MAELTALPTSEYATQLSGITTARKPRIIIIGAGVVGLTTAVAAMESGKYDVSLRAEKGPQRTVSAEAGASFKPHEIGYTDRTHQMVIDSWSGFSDQLTHYGTASGVKKHIHWEATSNRALKIPEETPYTAVVENFQQHTHGIPGNYAYAWSYNTFHIDPRYYLKHLEDRLKAGGVSLRYGVAQRLHNLDQLQNLSADVVINCTGLGARRLCNDTDVYPIAGQMLVIPRLDDWENRSISADGFYIYTRTDNTVLGGTAVPDSYDTRPSPHATAAILNGHKRVLPTIKPDWVTQTYVGLRPGRRGEPRVEREEIGKDMLLVHNYGHGGAGHTVSWGTARRALSLI